MKKRKPPIVLATCLVLLLVAVGIIYAPKSAASPEDAQREQQEQMEQANANAERPAITPTQASQFVKGQMQGAKGGPPTGPNGGPPKGMMGPNGGDRSSIEAIKPSMVKPKPNDSSTSTQWYTPETQK